MWLVNAALRRPYTVWVGMLLVLVLGIVSYRRTPTDILPNLKVPVVVVFASYRGMPAPDMEQSVTLPLERALTKCDRLDHIESRSLLGIGIIHVYFRSEVEADLAASQVIALVSSEMQFLPPGLLFPTIMKYDASAVPVGNLIISSNSREDKELLDLADHGVRDELANIEGLAPAPVFGGVFRQVQIYVHPHTLEALQMSPMDVARIVNQQSQVIPTGEIRIGNQNYYVSSNSMVAEPKAFEKIPIWREGRKVVYLGDVASVVDGERWRTNTVRVDGRRAVYMPLLRQAGSSAVRVVDNVRDFLPQLHQHNTLPEDVQVEVAFDQSKYVREALYNLRMEALGGAVLASLVVLLFLGNLRSTLIVALSIPLSILAAFVGLYFTGNTLNIMTLGGLALVLGRVVDDSIVDVENTLRHLGLGKTPLQAARDSAIEIAVPVFMATITTVIVFLPLIFMEGIGKYLFTPLAVSAVLAMFASYFVSRTVSPLYCARMLRPLEEKERFPWWLLVLALVLAGVGGLLWLLGGGLDLLPWGWRAPFHFQILPVPSWLTTGAGLLSVILFGLAAATTLLFRIAPWFDRLYDQFANRYATALRAALRWRWGVVALVLVFLVPTGFGLVHLGQELFPEVDASEFTVHMRATGGPRVEETERQVAEIEEIIRRDVVPADDLGMIVSNIGLSSRWSAIYTSNNGPHAAFVRVQLRSGFAGRRTPAVAYVEQLRTRLRAKFPTHDFIYETGGMIRRILNSGAVAPIEVQVHGWDAETRRTITRKLSTRVRGIAKVEDTYMPQGLDLPQLRINVNRTKAQLLGYTETDVIRNVIAALMSSAQLVPNLWIDPQSGNPYFIGVQYPEHVVENIQTLEDIPITAERGRANTAGARLLKDVADIERTNGPVEVYHQNAQRVSQLFVTVIDNDLAGVAGDVQRLADTMKPELPKGYHIEVRGEVSSMRQSFAQIAFTLALAVLLVYLILAAQFSSWLDPLIMIVAAPLGLIGVVFMLLATNSSLNIQSLMGVLMMVGISVSNSVLLVEFANRQRAAGLDALAAIESAARIRLRPILMTTLATVAGLLPMALHFHPGDEMNLPLARAVIGGLLGSTVLTLFVVPVLFVLLKPRGSSPGVAAVAEPSPS